MKHTLIIFLSFLLPLGLYGQLFPTPEEVSSMEKLYASDPDNFESHESLGVAYYRAFTKMYGEKGDVPGVKEYARKSRVLLEEAYSAEGFTRPAIRLSLLQLSHYFGDEEQSLRLENESIRDGNRYFPLLAFGSVPSKEFFVGRGPLPQNWRTDYSVNIFYACHNSLSRIRWYSKHLSAMNEPTLWPYTEGDEIRFLYLRSFHNPIVVRLVKTGDTVTLIYKKTDGAGGYEPGELTVDKGKKTDSAVWSQLKGLLQNNKIWQAEGVTEEEVGFDGAQWIIEANIDGKYHVVDRWGGSGIHELGTFMLDLAGIRPKGDTFY